MDKRSLKNRLIPLNGGKPFNHIKTFSNYLFNGISGVTVLYPEMVNYMSGFKVIDRLDT